MAFYINLQGTTRSAALLRLTFQQYKLTDSSPTESRRIPSSEGIIIGPVWKQIRQTDSNLRLTSTKPANIGSRRTRDTLEVTTNLRSPPTSFDVAGVTEDQPHQEPTTALVTPYWPARIWCPELGTLAGTLTLKHQNWLNLFLHPHTKQIHLRPDLY